MKKKNIIACPTCETSLEWDPNNPYRPFCSERCKLIDLGEWASESYKIPTPEQPSLPEEDENN